MGGPGAGLAALRYPVILQRFEKIVEYILDE